MGKARHAAAHRRDGERGSRARAGAVHAHADHPGELLTGHTDFRSHPMTLPGLRIPAGSRAALIARCMSRTAGESSDTSPLALEQTHAVLAGDRASEREGGVDDLRERLLRASARLVVTGRNDEERMQVAVRRMRDVGDEHVIRESDGLDASEHLHNGGFRDAHVFGQDGTEAFQGRIGQSSGGEERLPLGLVRAPVGPRGTAALEAANSAAASSSPAAPGVSTRPSSTTAASPRAPCSSTRRPRADSSGRSAPAPTA